MIDKKTKILESGRQLFSSKGFKDTNVAEITKLAGMATGTFYNYYSSKDTLFMDIYLEENVKLKKSIMEKMDLAAHPMEVMSSMMYLNTAGMQSNPILKEWYNRDVFSRIEQVYREEHGIDRMDFMYDSFIEVVRKWQSQGKFRKDISAEMIMAVFNALINIDTHKDEIGLEYFPQVMEYMADFIMTGLMDCSKQESE